MLENPTLKAEWGSDWWKLAFDACGSPGEWEEFQQAYRDDPRVTALLEELQRIDDRNQLVPRSRIRTHVDLSDLVG